VRPVVTSHDTQHHIIDHLLPLSPTMVRSPPTNLVKVCLLQSLLCFSTYHDLTSDDLCGEVMTSDRVSEKQVAMVTLVEPRKPSGGGGLTTALRWF
jgi:hypothetical protein